MIQPNLLVILSELSTSGNFRYLKVLLTEHCVKLLWVEVPLPPGCLVTLGLGIVGMVEFWFCPK